jgi:hypothetical protein
MFRRALAPAIVLVLTVATAAIATPSLRKSPAWLSIESPVNPYDRATRGAALLVHASTVQGTTHVSDLTGSAEGLVAGARRSVALKFDSTSKPDVYALRRQWPQDGTWLLRISLQSTTAIVSLDRDGAVVGVRIPTAAQSEGQFPRAVTAREIDSTLMQAAKR